MSQHHDDMFCGEEDDGQRLKCSQCMEVISSPAAMVVSGHSPFHLDCLNAKRHLDRAVNSSPDAAALQQWRKAHPQEYRYKTMELRMGGEAAAAAGAGGIRRRGGAEKAMAAQIIAELRRFSRLSEQHRVFLLSERAFKAYFIREEGYTAEEAAARWDRDSTDKAIFRTTAYGELKVAVRGHITFIHEEGTERSNTRQLVKPDSGRASDLEFEQGATAAHFRGTGMAAVFAKAGSMHQMRRSSRSRGSRPGRRRDSRSPSLVAGSSSPPSTIKRPPFRRAESGLTDDNRRAKSRSTSLARIVASRQRSTPPPAARRREAAGSARRSRSRSGGGRSAGAGADPRDDDGDDPAVAIIVDRSVFRAEPKTAADMVKDKKAVSDFLEGAIALLDKENSALLTLMSNFGDGNERIREYDIKRTQEEAKTLVDKARAEVKQARATKAWCCQNRCAGKFGIVRAETDAVCFWGSGGRGWKAPGISIGYRFLICVLSGAFRQRGHPSANISLRTRQGVDRWLSAKKELISLLSSLEDKGDEVRAGIDVCQDIQKSEKNSARRSKNNLRYQMQKFAKKFQANGCNASVARMGSELIYYSGKEVSKEEMADANIIQAPPLGKLDFSVPFMLNAQDIPDNYQNLFMALSGKMIEKEAAILKKLSDAENKAMRGRS